MKRLPLLFVFVFSFAFVNTQAQELLVGFKDHTPKSSIIESVGRSRQIADLGVYVVDQKLRSALSRNPHVEFIEENRLIIPSDLTPNDPFYPNAWAFPKISASAAWSVTTGSAVVIAVLDTGVNPNHPDLQGKFVAGWNIFNNNSDTNDVTGHGTAVASIIAANSDNSIGNASVCWGCLVMPIRVSNAQGLATFADMADGIIWAKDHGAQLVNLSYHASGSQTVSRAAKRFRAVGGLTFVSAGNSGLQETLAADLYLIAVSATDENDALESYSNHGPYIDLSAPGHFTVQCEIGGQWFSCGFDGTSTSAALATGEAALIKSLHPTWTPTQIEAKLNTSIDDLGTPGYDIFFGWGRINLLEAVQ